MHAIFSNIMRGRSRPLELDPLRLVAWLVVLALVFFVSIHGLVTLSTVLSSRLDYPLHDEFRVNLRYLDNPFPLNVLILENGHRTIFPGMIRLVDLHWFGGHNHFQMSFAWSLALLSLLLWARVAVRNLPGIHIVASLSVLIAFLVWNAQTRMFIHAYETSHILFTFFGLTLALWGWFHASQGGWKAGWLAVSLGGAVFAMFSFGPGVAVFGALFALMWIQRVPPRVAVVGTLVLVFCLLLYTVLLPGADGVRNSTRAFQFEAAPFLLLTRLGSPLHEILSPLWGRDDPVAVLLCTLAGATILVLMLRHAYLVRRSGAPVGAWDVLVLGTFAFACAANFVIVIGRSDYLMENTAQLFADRYLFWGSLAWMAFFLHCLGWAGTECAAVERRRILVLLGVTGVIVSMLPIARDLNIWAGAVRREVVLAASAQFAGLREDARLSRISDSGVDVAVAADARMREMRLGHYRSVAGVRELQVIAFQRRGDLPSVILRRQADGLLGTDLQKPHARPWRNRHLLVLDDAGRVLASGMLTLASNGPKNRWRIGRPVHDWLEMHWVGGNQQPAWLVGERNGVWYPIAQVAWQR